MYIPRKPSEARLTLHVWRLDSASGGFETKIHINEGYLAVFAIGSLGDVFYVVSIDFSSHLSIPASPPVDWANPFAQSICPIPKPRKKVGSTEFRETRSFYCNISLATGVLTSNTRGMWVATFAHGLVHMTIKQKDFEGAMLCTYSEVLEARCRDSSCSIEVVVPEDESDQSFLFFLQKKEQPSFNMTCLG